MCVWGGGGWKGKVTDNLRLMVKATNSFGQKLDGWLQNKQTNTVCGYYKTRLAGSYKTRLIN